MPASVLLPPQADKVKQRIAAIIATRTGVVPEFFRFVFFDISPIVVAATTNGLPSRKKQGTEKEGIHPLVAKLQKQ